MAWLRDPLTGAVLNTHIINGNNGEYVRNGLWRMSYHKTIDSALRKADYIKASSEHELRDCQRIVYGELSYDDLWEDWHIRTRNY